jgi:hypothetical protein
MIVPVPMMIHPLANHTGQVCDENNLYSKHVFHPFRPSEKPGSKLGNGRGERQWRVAERV